jgi:hypothetical protein
VCGLTTTPWEDLHDDWFWALDDLCQSCADGDHIHDQDPD